MAKDTLINTLPSSDEIHWSDLLDNNKIFRVNQVAKHLGYTCQVVITNGLFRIIYPFAEEGVKSWDFESRIEEILKILKKNFKQAHSDRYIELTISTNIKEVLSYDKVLTFKDGKFRSKRVKVFIGWILDNKSKPALILGNME